ncbi:unnamed protein product [Rhizophagus irregularis]|nr:unnamed protein product [Rhizophagus irregularis]
MFRFIYCGNIELKNLQGPDVLKLLIAVDELNIHQLISHIQEYLIEHQTQNPTGILEIVYQHETFTDLWEFCLEKICEEPEILFNSNEFISLKAPLLELLLKRDDLNMNEIEVWEGRDGFDAASFHRNWYNKGATIWVAKIQDSTQLIGGYNPLDWNGNCGWKTTRDSFLFNFTNEKNTSTAKLGYVKIPENAIYCSNDRGPQMGFFLCYGSNKWINNAHQYPEIGIPNTKFTVENYEVFQVIKK